jgi:hypothetical protein
MKVWVAAVCVIAVVQPASAQEQYVPYLQRALLLRIGDCKTSACIKSAVAGAPYLDPPLKLIAASRWSQIDAAAAGQSLLEALPRIRWLFGFAIRCRCPRSE